MTKVATSFYSAPVGHKQVEGVYMASFAIPGHPPAWVYGADGTIKYFTSAMEAELYGYRTMMSKLNKTNKEQQFYVRGSKPKDRIRSWSAPKDNGPTIDSVFRKKP